MNVINNNTHGHTCYMSLGQQYNALCCDRLLPNKMFHHGNNIQYFGKATSTNSHTAALSTLGSLKILI